MEVTQEKIEKVAQFANVSAAQAQQALEQCGGHQLEAVLLLEQKGRSRQPTGGTWSTEWENGGAPREEVHFAETVPPKGARGKQIARELVDILANLVRNFARITIDIWRGNDLLAGIPLIICILLVLIAPYVMIPLAIVGVAFLHCRYHVSGWDYGEAAINRTMDEVSDTVDELVTPIRKRVKQEFKSMRNDLHQRQKNSARQADREAEEKKK